LFAWHPLRVESVAWIAERKDVLSLFCFGLLLNAYAHYAQKPTRGRYAAALGIFALGLLAKPMLVTAPFVLLLLDFWPLSRTDANRPTEENAPVQPPQKSWTQLVIEKIPFFILALASCLITVWAQHQGGAIKSTDAVPPGLRGLNAIVSYAGYLEKIVLPVNLAVLYPLPASYPATTILLSLGLLLLLTFAAWISRKTRPYILVGWLWYLGTLVPVIGLVQVGMQAMADRYTYLPSIGIFLMVVWTAADWLAENERRLRIGSTIAVLVLTGCVLGSSLQLRHWRNSITLFERCADITPNNPLAWNNLGIALSENRRTGEAVTALTEAVRLDPDYVNAHYNLGIEFANLGKISEAKHHFSEALRLQPSSAAVHVNFGVMLAQQKEFTNAISHFQAAVALMPDYGRAHLNLALVLTQIGRIADAIAEYRRALQLQPDSPEALDKFAWLLATTPDGQFRDGATAVKLAERANQLTANSNPAYLHTLAAACAETGNFPAAVNWATKANEKASARGFKDLAAKTKLALELYRQGQPYRDIPD